MAITRSQQAKQMLQDGGMLVKPGFGGTRQGYRGPGGYQGGRKDTAPGAAKAGPVERGGGRDPSKQYQKPPTLSEAAEKRLKDQRSEARYQITPSTRPRNRIISALASSFIPFGGLLFNKAIDNQAMGFNTPSITEEEDDDFEDRDRGGDEPFIPMMATPFQQDVIKKTAEEISPIELAIQQRDALAGPRAFAKEGGIMDLETGRQMYFLGKLVKKAKKAVKKIVKSPVGKTALAAAGIFKLGGGSFSNLIRGQGSGFDFSRIPGSSFFSDMDRGDAMKLALGAGLTAAPLLFQQDDSDDEYQKFLASRGASGQSLDIQGIRNDPYSFLARPFRAEGGIMRLGFDDGDKDLSKDPNYKGWKKTYETNPDAAEMNENHKRYLNFYERNKNAQAEGSKEPVAKKTMPLLDMGGMEKDYREDGGFVPIGRMEKADDVPARLSKNEFVFTADAVRNAGDGNVDKGAEVMYNMMKNLEAGGEVSEESQGLKGARKMFQTSQRLEEVL